MEDSQIPREGSLGSPESSAPPESLNISVAIIGPRGSGKSTLTRTLSQQKEQFGPDFLNSYFKVEDGSHGVTCHPYPPLPNVTLLDFPGYRPGDSASLYLEGIKPTTVQYLVVTLGESVSSTDVQLVGTLKKMGRPHCIVQTHTDLTLHTKKRQQGKSYWRGQVLQGLRQSLEEHFKGSEFQGLKMFLVSCLEPQMFDFPSMVDYMEGDILQCSRSADNTAGSQGQELATHFEVTCDENQLAQFPSLLIGFLDNPPPVPVVVGVTGNEKDAFLQALSEPPVSCFVVRPLPGPRNPPLTVEQYLENLQLEDCDVYLIEGSGMDPSSRTTLVEALVAAGKHCMLIGGDGKRGKGQNADEGEEPGKRADHLGSDLSELRMALEKGVPLLVRERLLQSLPSIILQLVRRERRKLMTGIYPTCLDVCSMASNGHLPEALTSLSSALSSYRERFGLGDDTLASTAQMTNCPVEDLRSEIRCPMAQNPSEEQLLQMASQPLSLSSIVWSYIPLLGGGETVPTTLSPERTYRLLVESVWGMAEDAERVLLRACAKQKVGKERNATCHWPCM